MKLDILIINIMVPVIIALLASSGFWMFLEKRTRRNSVQTKLLMGLAHDRIVYLCLKYIERGWITHDEFENLHVYLFKPYKDLSGNGGALKLMDAIIKLPIRKDSYFITKD